MSVDRTKVLEAAQKHLAKGAFDKAIAEFQKLVVADPSDVRTWLKIGDLQSKIGKSKDAVDTYLRVADQYSAQGFHLKAVAVHKQILKLDGTRLDVQLKLAAAYESLQLVSDALGTFEQVAAAQARSGDIPAAVNTLARMVELDPESVPTRIKYAEALSRTGRTKEAADAFEAGASLLKAQGRIDDYLKVAERLLYHREGDVELSRELAKLYLERNDAKRALSKLQTCFKSDPKHVPTLELLAQAFEQLGQLPKTVSVYREVARIHGEAGKGPERAATLKRILELDPGDAEARQALATFASQPKSVAPPARRDLAPPPGAVVEPSSRHEAARAAAVAASQASGGEHDDHTLHGDPMEMDDDGDVVVEAEEMEESELSEAEAEALAALDADLDGEAIEADELAGDAPKSEAPDSESVEVGDDDDVLIVDEAPESVPARAPSYRAPARSAPAAAGTLPPEVAREAQIAKLLTECDVYLRYGLKQKVVDQLRRVLDIDPSHVEAREKLKDVLVDRGEHVEAAAELLVLAELFTTSKPSLASMYLRQAAELDPGNPELEARLAALSSPGTLASPSRTSLPPATFEPPTKERPSVPEAPVAPVVPPPASVSISIPKPKGLVPRPVVAPPPPDSVPPQPLSVPPEDGVFFVEDEPHTAEEAPASEKTVYEEMPDDGLLDPMSPEEFEKAPLRPSMAGPSMDAMDRVSRPSLPPGEVEELLDEAEFFVAQGLYDEAIAMLSEARNAHPKNRLLADKIAELEEARAAAAASQPAPPADADRSYELAEKLQGELDAGPVGETGSDVLDVEQVFAQFKKGVEQQVGLEDTDTHFDLGIAYKEMGLLQDAISEFEICAANPVRECIAHTMIGLCLIEKNDITGAIGHFKKGLYADQKTDREELGLYYELGRAYEQLRDPKEAVYYYEKVKKRDPGFRGVDDRIRALTTPSGTSPTPAAPVDDIDAAFDDLMGKD